MEPQPASTVADDALRPSLRLALRELDGGLRSWTDAVGVILRGLAHREERTRRRAFFCAIALTRRPMEGASALDAEARRKLARALVRLEERECGFRRVRACVYFPANISVVGRDDAGNLAKKGRLRHTWGTSLYDEHQELPIEGSGWRRDRVFVVDDDGSERPIGPWLRVRGTFVLCSRCGADVTDVYAPRSCPWFLAQRRRARSATTSGSARAGAGSPEGATVRSRAANDMAPPAKTASMAAPPPPSRLPTQPLAWTIDGVRVAGAARKISGDVVELVITDPSRGALAGRVSHERDNPLALRPLWKRKTLTEEGRALVDARARTWVPHWLRLAAHAGALHDAVDALLPAWRAARATELDAERGRARVLAEWRSLRGEGRIDEEEHDRRVEELRRRESTGGLPAAPEAGATLWRHVVEAARDVVGSHVDPWVLARFLDARRRGP